MLLAVPHDALQGRVVLFSDKKKHEKVKAEQLKTNISSHIYVVYLYNHTDVRTSAVSCLYIFPAPVHCFYSYLQWVCVPFVVTNPATSNITEAALTSLYQEPWMGKLEPEDIGTWMDELLFLVRKKGRAG